MLDRPWVGRTIVVAAIIVVAVGVAVRILWRSSDRDSESGWASRRDRAPASPEPAEVDDYIRRMREAHAKELRALAGVPPAADPGVNDHLTPEQAAAAHTPSRAYPGATTEIIFEPTKDLREFFGHVGAFYSSAGMAGAVVRYRAENAQALADAGLTEPVDDFAAALADGKTIEEALTGVFAKHGVKGQKAFDSVLDSKLADYKRRLNSYSDQPEKASKMNDYAERIERLLMLQIEMQKSIKYGHPSSLPAPIFTSSR